jgi:hypothetical protein
MTEQPHQSSTQSLDSICIEESRPWGFVTKRVFLAEDGSRRYWISRHHRKNLHYLKSEAERRLRAVNVGSMFRCLWMPGQLNWWIGNVFAIGAFLFAVASLLSLLPSLASAWSLDASHVNAIYFVGSLPFTTAAGLQLFQAANAREVHAGEEQPPGSWKFFGWRPHDIGWLSCTLQFVGTILFNFNTWDAMLPSLDWLQQDLFVWVPDMIGSILFLASGYLAFVETCHSPWRWWSTSVSWWVVFTNLLGCIGFMVAAVFAFVLPTVDHTAVTISLVFTLFGAVGFFVGSLLMLPEMIVIHDPQE